jgi:predicted porin
MKSPLLPVFGVVLIASAAFAAESDITLYGLVDLGISTTHISDRDAKRSSRTGVMSGGLSDSIFGLRGQEVLSHGWSAHFQLETLFDSATGSLSDADYFFNNSAWLGIASDQFGALRLGRQHTVAQQFASQLEVGSWKDMGMGSTLKASDNYQVQNAINYLSPVWAGLSFGVGYSFDILGDQTSGNKPSAVSAAIQYNRGPLLLVATWDKTYLTDTTLANARDPQTWQVGASYDFEIVKVSAAWSRQRNGYTGFNGGDPDHLGLSLGAAQFAYGGRLDAYLLGLSVPVGARGKFLAQWSLVKPDWSWQNGEKAASGRLATLGYVYSLSSRASLYLWGGVADHYSLENQLVQGQGTTTRFMVGLSHAF